MVQTGLPFIHTSTGERFYILDPRPEDMEITVIAHALSQLVRWTGHTDRFFSVAQHCIMVSNLVPEEFALTGLLHDASEAFIGDLNYPLKQSLERVAPGVIKGIEDNIHRAIAQKYGIVFPFDPCIKKADTIGLATEHRDLMPNSEWWDDRDRYHPTSEVIVPLSPVEAEVAYLQRFKELA